VRLNANPFSPEYDKVGLGRIEIFTKPGTDQFHGTIGYNLGTDRWNARNPYAVQKAPFLLQESENNFSGPITKLGSFTVPQKHPRIPQTRPFSCCPPGPRSRTPLAGNEMVI
jgi:hypothetical protein